MLPFFFSNQNSKGFITTFFIIFLRSFKIILHAHPHHADQNCLSALQEISKSWKTFQRFTDKPKSFKLAMVGGIKLNSKVSLDLMKLENKLVLHVLELRTNFLSACFLAGESMEEIWQTSICYWSSINTGYSYLMEVDPESSFIFTNPKFGAMTSFSGIQIKLSRVKSHSYGGAGE